MASKRETNSGGIVFSTDPGFPLVEKNTEILTLPPEQQRLRISLDKKQRAGKSVTLIRGFQGAIKDLEELGKKLKSICGTGGSVKDNEIIVQGDNRIRITEWLKKNNYR